MTEMSVRDILDEAYDKAWNVLLQTLDEHKIPYDESSDTLYVDDTVNKRTYFASIQIDECDEYIGD